jgi:hypothetical protein
MPIRCPTPRELARLATDPRVSRLGRAFYRLIALPALTAPVLKQETRPPRQGGSTHEDDDE